MSATALRIVEGSSMDKTRALSAALSQIERQFGKGSVMKLGKNDRSMDIETISSGSLNSISRSASAGCRGDAWSRSTGRTSGKTTLALHTVAEGQKKGGICAFIDAEHALDPVDGAQARRQHRRAADLAAGYRRAGFGNLRHLGALWRGRRAGGRTRLRRWCRRPNSRAKWAMRCRAWQALADEPRRCGSHRLDQQVQHHGYLHRPDPHEDRADERRRKPPPAATRRNFTPPSASTPAASARSRSATKWSGRHHPRQGGEEQAGAALQAGRVRHHVWRGRLQDGRNPRSRRQGRHRREIRRLVLL